MTSPAAGADALLSGWDGTEGVVGLEIRGREAILIRARGSERVQDRHPFRPWLLCPRACAPLVASWTEETRELQGSELDCQVFHPSWTAFGHARDCLRAEGVPVLAYANPLRQHLLLSGITFYRGLELEGVRRMQLDLETSSLSPHESGSRILLIAVAGGEEREWLLGPGDERQLIEELIALVRDVDPDIIEGHNLYGFDLPYLAARAETLGVPLALGRDGSLLRFGREARAVAGGRGRRYRPPHAWGRQLLDTYLGVQRYDMARGEMESYGLKAAAAHFGLAAPDRVVLDRARIAELMEREPERVREYALQDVRESRALAELVFPADFYLAQMAPDDLETIATSGTGEKIDALMVRAALRAGRGIPLPEPPRASPGGLTELREAGVIRRVAKADVESLYPSLMLTYDIRPARDELGVFLPMLRSLTERRLDAKARASEPGPRRAYWNGLQSSFKILINSFYGYLGGPFHFNDHDAAAEVTRRGRELVAGVARRLTETGSRVIEIDTDGIYFVPPLEAATAEDEDAYVARLAAELPDGIRLVHEARYAVMISLKVKNYALIGYDGRRVLHGASLRSRADEPYGRDFLSRAIDRLADDDLDGLARLYQETIEAILDGRVPIRDLARRERVTEKTLTSDARRRSRDAAGAAPEGSLMTVYERRDGTLGRIEQYAGDEDRVHYVEKLHRFAARLEPALGDRFQTVFPRPDTRRIQAEVGGQLRLF